MHPLPLLACLSLTVLPAEDDKAPARRTVAAQEAQAIPQTYDADHGPLAAKALRDGLKWLATQQAKEPDGSFSAGNVVVYPRVGAAALGALAFLSSGSTPGRGPYGREVTRAIEYLLSKTDLDPNSPSYGYISDTGDKKSEMHGHGLATLALTQALTVSRQTPLGRQLDEAVQAAIALIQKTQGSEGGWYYKPRRSAAHEGSITITMVQALRAARNSGYYVDPEVIARALDYVKRSQAENGSFRYAIGSDKTSVALTAAAISTLNATGVYHGKEVEDGYLHVFRELAGRDALRDVGQEPDAVTFPYYERLYLAQAFWQHSDRRTFPNWFTGELERMIATQGADGSWRSTEFSDVYATATCCLVLALPDSLLPIYQR